MMSGITALSSGEMTACMKTLGAYTTGQENDRRQQVIAIFAAFYRTRFGVAPGSTAVNLKTGQSAIRFYDQINKAYRWAVHDNPEEVTQQVRYTDELNPPVDWTITERPWNDLVYKVGLYDLRA